MFIHIGNDSVIRSREIILIVNHDVITSSSIMNEMIEAKTKENKVKKGTSVAKSVIITNDSVYYSSLSVSTLKKRSSIGNMISKFENYSIEK